MGEYRIEENDSGRRIDRILKNFLKVAPLSLIYSSIRKGLVKLNGKKTKAESKAFLGDVLYIAESLELLKKKETPNNFSKNDLDVILKTKDLLFINKRRGDLTHGGGSIDEKVKKTFRASESLSFSIGTLHRLDKDTTGVLTFSQSLKGAIEFSKALQEGCVDRYYIGINEGKIREGLWKLPIEKGEKIKKTETTNVVLLEYSKKDDLSFSFYKLITGKKHQIRHGALQFGTPLLCDRSYGSKRKDYSSYFLHSICLKMTKQIFYDLPSIIVASIPNDFLNAIKKYFPKRFNELSKNKTEEVLSMWLKEFFSF